MAYGALVLQVLISSPSDFPPADRDVVQGAIRAWNADHGRLHSVQYSPVSGTDNVAPAFAAYAQETVNDQIVNDSDVALVFFTDRIGTPTPGGHRSGTVEEIERMLKRKRDVAVFRNNMERKPLRGGDAADQAARLDAYLREIQARAFVSEYESHLTLQSVVTRTLTLIARKFQREVATIRVEQPYTVPVVVTSAGERSHDESAESTPLVGGGGGGDAPKPTIGAEGVWPRVEVGVDPVTGKQRTVLALESNLPFPARDVAYRYESRSGDNDTGFSLRADEGVVADILPPFGKIERPIFRSWGAPDHTMCVVTWKDEKGEEQETRATVRAF